MPFNKIIFKKFALKTLVKIVFVPFMYSGFLGNLNILLNTDLAWTAPAVSVLLYNIVVSIDMLIGIFGYFLVRSYWTIKLRMQMITGWGGYLLCCAIRLCHG